MSLGLPILPAVRCIDDVNARDLSNAYDDIYAVFLTSDIIALAVTVFLVLVATKKEMIIERLRVLVSRCSSLYAMPWSTTSEQRLPNQARFEFINMKSKHSIFRV